MISAKHPARHAALTTMRTVLTGGRTLDEALAPLDAPPETRAAARRLATGAFRFAARADRLTGPHLRKRPEIDVLNAFRLALYEINEAGTPAHAAVDAAVSLVAPRQRGLVNAILRRIGREAIAWETVPNPTPKWLRKRLIAAWGREATDAMEAVHAMTPPVDLTVKEDATGWAERLGGTPLPSGSVRISPGVQVSALPGFAEGAWWVQDAAAALPVRALNVAPGERVLDLCAAPGGKTMQLAAAGAQVTALDISRRRMERIRENLARTGLTAELVVADALDWQPGGDFDAILLDAPCSATGTLRRHPELPWARDGAEIAALRELQARLLDRAADWLAPGGRLVFCTCSLLPEEGEDQAEALRPALAVETIEGDWVQPAWRTEKGLRIRPDHWAKLGGIDGFFIARFTKRD